MQPDLCGERGGFLGAGELVGRRAGEPFGDREREQFVPTAGGPGVVGGVVGGEARVVREFGELVLGEFGGCLIRQTGEQQQFRRAPGQVRAEQSLHIGQCGGEAAGDQVGAQPVQHHGLGDRLARQRADLGPLAGTHPVPDGGFDQVGGWQRGGEREQGGGARIRIVAFDRRERPTGGHGRIGLEFGAAPWRAAAGQRVGEHRDAEHSGRAHDAAVGRVAVRVGAGDRDPFGGGGCGAG